MGLMLKLFLNIEYDLGKYVVVFLTAPMKLILGLLYELEKVA